MFLSLRKFPLVVRFHKPKKDQHLEYIYSELLLYKPFRSEDEFCRDNEERCIALYLDKYPDSSLTKIEAVKNIVMPYLNSVLEGREKAEELLAQQKSMGDTLDPTMEQANDDIEDEVLEQHPDLSILHHDSG